MKKIILLAFVLVLLSTAVVVGLVRPVEANGTFYIRADGSVGVKAGDWIEYDYTTIRTGGIHPPEAEEEWRKVEFLKVEGTTVNILVTHPSGEHEFSEGQIFDVVAGGSQRGGKLGGFSGFVIPANSKTGDSFSIRYGNITIAGETKRTYAGARRTVFYADFHFHPTSPYGKDLTYYWDKQTGVMVEASEIGRAGNITFHVTAKATKTNMWEAVLEEEVPFWVQWWLWTIVAVVVVVLAGAVYFMKKKKQPTPTAPTPSAEGTLQNTTQNTNPLNSYLPSLFSNLNSI